MLTSAITGALRSVVFVTHDRYAGLVSRFEGVQQVIGLKPGEGVGALARRLPEVEWVVDLHGSLRSRALSRRLAAPVSRVDKLGLARRTRVAWKRPERIPFVIDRYAQAAGVDVAPRPWIPIERSPRPDALVLVPGAAHPTKCWPAFRYRAIADRWPGPAFALGSLAEDPLLRDIWKRTEGRVVPVAERGFDDSLRVLRRAAIVVGGDTGLLHLAAACGVPVVGLYGPTTSADGFWCHPGEVLEEELPCRPCSLHGSQTCPIGDHRCMNALSVGRVWQAVRDALRSATRAPAP